jgi:hypothetical protein
MAKTSWEKQKEMELLDYLSFQDYLALFLKM